MLENYMKKVSSNYNDCLAFLKNAGLSDVEIMKCMKHYFNIQNKNIKNYQIYKNVDLSAGVL
jgi:hypothetical protein